MCMPAMLAGVSVAVLSLPIPITNHFFTFKLFIMKNANDLYANFTCTNAYYTTMVEPYVFTDGVKAMCEECGCYWFLNLILSHQHTPKVKAETFQVWHLKRIFQEQFTATADDGNGNIIARQNIEFSDFAFDEATVWLVDEVLLLPSEY